MAYASTQQIQIAAGGAEKLAQLADFDADGMVDAAVIAQAQAEVDGWINSYAAKRYAVPLSAPSLAVQACAASEVVYWLRTKRSMITEQDVAAKADRTTWLKGLASGHVVPSDPLPAPSTTVRSAWVERDSEATGQLTRENTEGSW